MDAPGAPELPTDHASARPSARDYCAEWRHDEDCRAERRKRAAGLGDREVILAACKSAEHDARRCERGRQADRSNGGGAKAREIAHGQTASLAAFTDLRRQSELSVRAR